MLVKFKQIAINHLIVALLISVLFLSKPQLMLSSVEQSIPQAFPEVVHETYPRLNFSTYFGGSEGLDKGNGIAVSEDNSCYITGRTESSDFPTQNAYNSTLSGVYDAFVSKFNASGSLLWSTYLGGSEGLAFGYSLAVTGDGSCFITGDTSSDDFPILNAFDNTLGAFSDAFVTKFIDTPIPTTQSSKQPSAVPRFLVFIVVMPIAAFIPVIALILHKKRK